MNYCLMQRSALTFSTHKLINQIIYSALDSTQTSTDKPSKNDVSGLSLKSLGMTHARQVKVFVRIKFFRLIQQQHTGVDTYIDVNDDKTLPRNSAYILCIQSSSSPQTLHPGSSLLYLT